jgi:predicted pyridoxine 5'-phosphate oxidase superfamily flavin-nucleotide-binding protein
MNIPDNVRALFDRLDIVSFGTADADGMPNICAVFWKKIVGKDTIMLLDNYFKQTKQNLAVNNKVCISFWDSSIEKGFKIKGTAVYHTKGAVFEQGKEWLQSKKPGRVPHGVVAIKVDKIYDLEPGEHAGAPI